MRRTSRGAIKHRQLILVPCAEQRKGRTKKQALGAAHSTRAQGVGSRPTRVTTDGAGLIWMEVARMKARREEKSAGNTARRCVRACRPRCTVVQALVRIRTQKVPSTHADTRDDRTRGLEPRRRPASERVDKPRSRRHQGRGQRRIRHRIYSSIDDATCGGSDTLFRRDLPSFEQVGAARVPCSFRGVSSKVRTAQLPLRLKSTEFISLL